jgi:hypothetical protein
MSFNKLMLVATIRVVQFLALILLVMYVADIAARTIRL